jgi:hypothetical protein
MATTLKYAGDLVHGFEDRITGQMETTDYRVIVRAEGVEHFDRLGLLDMMLNEVCTKDKLHPIAVLTAALVALKQRDG